MEEKFIKVTGAKEHNLKNVSIEIPKNELVVVTGLSGSGKSSLVFDTVYAEGQRRFIESLSAYARQFLDMQDKPDVESITGLSPAIAIDQKTTSRNPRSTVGTVTEIYDHFRLLFARIGVPYSPATGKPIESQSASVMVDKISRLPKKSRIYIMAPLVRGQKGEFRKEMMSARKQGFQRIKVDGKIHDLNEVLPLLDKNKKHDIEIIIDRIVMSDDLGNRLADSVETALKISDGLLYVEIVSLAEGVKCNHQTGEILVFSEKFCCPVSGFTIAEIEPRLFSFNSPFGACKHCNGLGTELYFSPDLIVEDENLTLRQGAIAIWQGVQERFYQQVLSAMASHYKFSLDMPFKNLPEEIKQKIFYGTDEEEVEIKIEDGLKAIKIKKPFEGVVNSLKKRFAESESDSIQDELAKFQTTRICNDCHGYRLNEQSLSVKIDNLHVGEVSAMSVERAVDWFDALPKNLTSMQNQIAERLLKEITRRLGFLRNVGLEYLTINREAGTLSGGEAQRIRLASQIGSGLSGVIYVLDEPSIGLHQSDNDKLIATLKNLRDLGNSVIVVEHDEEMMRESDYLIDVGPGAGIHGGEIIAQGKPQDVITDPKSITGQYLSGKKQIELPKKRRQPDLKKIITLKGATINNLKNLTLNLPLRVFTAVSGISGGGKSSLIIKTLYPALNKILNKAKVMPGPYQSISGYHFIDKIIEIDQSPIGRTPRSNPCTYVGAFTFIREFYTDLPESKARGYKVGRFSFNVKGGRCETCQGDGLIKIEMHFLPDVYVRCETCHGKRYNRETLEIKYRDKSISDVLTMTAEDACEFFKGMPHIHEKFKALCDVGLGYIKIGQSATTLSGGEAQRIKLAKELSRKATGDTLYILDEPTTGLHFEDISKLLKVLHKLVDSGNSILVIEHNLDVLKTADHIIDIGPCGGEKGGYIVAEGTPEEIAKNTKSVTGKYLAKVLKS
ncbi:MAG: excinuclease ABC subunit A [Alphaproteobacteria bacterium RIFCSPLOWO2_01_FULL_40_26]|nr:MAG: excinuclease ABC subunit A [Alphaproteobacteria bacterium RIFCSPHIGHO2_02_FULL_40_34]OFW95380.1 MAG: excinuclease ABC subunit A [Alphaproteobacteria bacterium RIFCSPLOWO2_01_FULL_40_26]OFX09276.1 MAG: excinuclease ABC subunit A [Alphaproteobacteria bacterium RIFCSPLOWO2_02_FULL_40_19]OFX10814.1 MAG: excinuclease ABC subunit A [Alphaproteobacteria bacterium RIFCSPLOWO2_12_FULL_40_11]